ncbi:hypothetical protein C3L33_03101, partial [Rhododendron williamsianum]
MIWKVRAINDGTAVSCHQILFPYLLYYCHSVPEVRVYQADILDPKTNIKINHAVALCHLDTSSWSADHGAFLALGSGPGKIELSMDVIMEILKIDQQRKNVYVEDQDREDMNMGNMGPKRDNMPQIFHSYILGYAYI